jgi:hypothetical protein
MEGSWRIAATTVLTTMRSARGPRPGTGTLTSPLKLTRQRCAPASSITVCCALQACRMRSVLALHVRLFTSADTSLTQANAMAHLEVQHGDCAYAHAQPEDSAQGCCRGTRPDREAVQRAVLPSMGTRLMALVQNGGACRSSGSHSEVCWMTNTSRRHSSSASSGGTHLHGPKHKQAELAQQGVLACGRLGQ